ncbi:N-acetylglucosamine kinase [Thermoanaerobacterium thermosaccharolyticum]|uniref:N-acetylglucosamine kinase n=1 Tax=Thermoanaerobacterium thermosaccharolyticum TaxID=1517 RepID=A0A223HXI5_THETR|nr:BadF/BadG/BcrA/BcrD ATPase family protein [Thermoanaerobacterium thermosaccharolyticum]AST56994.1 N-acetylglucosamine kinase [Thermoanaerobacterium thermosaccharolyticum]WHE06846.1 BadF/BadG/BcrA/BcrD ATPase family protein [Thermoanaerobacterium thermosaccharolyticum]
MKYVIGIDGGGTKSILTIKDVNGSFIMKGYGGTTNIRATSKENVEISLSKLIENSIKNANLDINDCAALCLGTAGAGVKEDKDTLKDIIKSIGIKGNIIVTNDAEIVIAAGTGKMEGVALISGTGSIAYGINNEGLRVRVGGWGHVLGDEGSGYYIGLEAIKAALRYYDGREPYTELLSMTMGKAHLEKPEDFVKYIYRDDLKKSEIASFAVLVDEAYQKGDNKAKEILLNSAWALFELSSAVIKRLKFGNERVTIVASGSVLIKNTFIFETLKGLIKEAYSNINIVKLTGDASEGALYIALNSLGTS